MAADDAYEEAGLEVTDEMRLWAGLKLKFDREFPNQPGGKTLVDETTGISYRRAFRKQQSNSRKSSRWMLDFIITKPDGTVTTVEDPAGPNRRSDPARNWGLGRE
ncbi:hypothetical protein [Falsiroseomonas sp.]|uniref:hypothetical protein n=1 Tax=Falsiroseomonas sp. TaxID=2870721 RepID=UPI002736C264|nr:hypothetical protein [Falsiroseomonas sp.]